MSEIYPHRFEAEIEKFGVGKARKIWYNVLMLPGALAADLPLRKYPRLRVEGEIADVPISNAFMPTGDGRHYVIVAPNVLKDGGVGLGDRVEMRFAVADQDHVDVPGALVAALGADAGASRNWQALTPGKKRMLAQHVASAKTPGTQAKRVGEALEALVFFKADLRLWRKARAARPD
ncbi:MAG: YdeI/OmpD-associated family protein [Pseudomonadota bacterium]